MNQHNVGQRGTANVMCLSTPWECAACAYIMYTCILVMHECTIACVCKYQLVCWVCVCSAPLPKTSGWVSAWFSGSFPEFDASPPHDEPAVTMQTTSASTPASQYVLTPPYHNRMTALHYTCKLFCIFALAFWTLLLHWTLTDWLSDCTDCIQYILSVFCPQAVTDHTWGSSAFCVAPRVSVLCYMVF